MKNRIFLAAGIILPFLLFTLLKPVISGSNSILMRSGGQIASKGRNVPGSSGYVWSSRLYSLKHGSKAALSKIIEDVSMNEGLIDKASYEENLRLYKTVSYYIGKIGNIDMKTHYFRNKLNRCPKTLNELLLQNKKLPKGRQWRLISVNGSLYHMQGPDGIYNLKFVSADGFCEAVYNKHGILLTEKNDPVNMGTFNYGAGIHEKNAHRKYDVIPYLEWGNSPDSPQKGYSSIQRGVQIAMALYDQNISNVLKYRKSVIEGAIFKGAAFCAPSVFSIQTEKIESILSENYEFPIKAESRCQGNP